MNITPINNNQTKAQYFGATVKDLGQFTEALRKVLPFGETDVFLSSLAKSKNKVQKINFKNQAVEISIDKIKNLKHSFNFKVISSLASGEGSADSEVKLGHWFFFPLSGKRIAKKLLFAAKDATDYIIEDTNYLQNKAAKVTTSLNGK